VNSEEGELAKGTGGIFPGKGSGPLPPRIFSKADAPGEEGKISRGGKVRVTQFRGHSQCELVSARRG